MEFYDYATLSIRVINAIIWTIVVVRVMRSRIPLTPTARALSATVIFFGMWVLVLGGTVQFGFPAETARFVYTVFTAYAGLIGIAMVTNDD